MKKKSVRFKKTQKATHNPIKIIREKSRFGTKIVYPIYHHIFETFNLYMSVTVTVHLRQTFVISTFKVNKLEKCNKTSFEVAL